MSGPVLEDGREFSAACARNREPILAELRRLLPAEGQVLELASGTGQHAAHFARALPGLRWIPSDRDDARFASVRAWTAGLPNVAAPVLLDLEQPRWVEPVDAIFCANMIHIAPWPVAARLFDFVAEAGRGPFVMYGPYRVGGQHTSASNADFDAWLRARDPASGVRDLEAVVALATARGIRLAERVQMPANNLLLCFVRA